MVDKLATYDNVLGVFADLDDGGLTEIEALAQIRGIVGAKKPVTEIVLMGTLPFTITVNLETRSVTEFEVNYTSPTMGDTAETRIDGELLDGDLYADEIIAARAIAGEDGDNWPDPERQ